ncbi:hypothetical protein EUTSA_v10015861mg [Eutrema salsugineum]|uniref:VHS domain-containing protein n=1 Tax=Eutrema salsugineum TaxID=72664 RepID=V4N3Z2_EUTSA|nr:TOM1-like protein 7 [Eutrema salsugineum]ESQ40036.1 hypothetical protein EUTSA_v10015861mg [Eutrema salsugineum]
MRPSSSSSSSSSASPSLTLSSVAVAVDKATSELLLTPDWTMIIAICDSVNINRWQCKDAIKAVKRRLQHKSSKVQLLTLTLLEAMLKNCGDFVHTHIAQKHLLEDMVKIVRKKGDYGVRNRILVLLDTWNEAFSGAARKYPHYNWAYQELTRSGVKFPQRSKEAPLMLAPPPASSSMNLMSIGSFRSLDETMATDIECLSFSSLDSMRNVMDLLNDMVQALNPSDKSALKDELIVDLVEQCRSNQKKLIQMLTTTADEDVMARGLELNDSLQVVLARHDAIASGVFLPTLQAPETRETSSVLESGDASAALESEPSSSSSSESETDDGEDVENDFTQLSKRHALLNAQYSDEEEEEETLLLGNSNEKTAESETNTQCKDLALFDKTATTTTKSEQDIIELLSLTLSTTALPASSQTQTQTQTQPPSNTHHKTSYDHILMNSYVVPWAQTQAEEPQVPKTAQFAPSGPQYQAWPPQQQFSYGYPHPQWNGGQANSYDTTFWSQGGSENKVFERNLHYSNSFPARAAGPSAAVDGPPHRPPYVPPYKLFEDLNVFCNRDGGVRSSK